MSVRSSKGNKPDNEELVVDFGDEPARQPSLSSLEEKYRDQMRQIVSSKIDLPLLTLKAQIEAQIELKPEFQRRDRWSKEKQSRFIESLIMNVPVPPVFLGEEDYGKYVVLDGRQRLTAIYRFLCNELRLEGLAVWSELNGLSYSEFASQGFAPTIERRFLPAVLLTRESSPEVKYEVFDRLNTGGVIANPMEVRNAIYPGLFNDLLHKLSRNKSFCRLWGIPTANDPSTLERNSLYKEMADLELVLRFLALRDGTLKGERFKDHLSLVMKRKNAEFLQNPSLHKQDEREFVCAVENCLHVFGETAFRRPDDTAPGSLKRRSAPYSDAVMQGLADYDKSDFSPIICKQIQKAFEDLAEKNKVFIRAVSTGTNGESAIRNRIRLAREVVESIVGKQRPKL